MPEPLPMKEARGPVSKDGKGQLRALMPGHCVNCPRDKGCMNQHPDGKRLVRACGIRLEGREPNPQTERLHTYIDCGEAVGVIEEETKYVYGKYHHAQKGDT